jgi:hypothetical protein
MMTKKNTKEDTTAKKTVVENSTVKKTAIIVSKAAVEIIKEIEKIKIISLIKKNKVSTAKE